MVKQLKNRNLSAGRVSRTLLAFSLSASLAAVGCTTNRNPGSGEPLRDGFVHTAPTGGVTGGSETPALPPPMTSSYTRPDNAYVGPDAAAAIMADRQPVRVLGVVNPGLSGSAYVSDGVVTGQYRNPALVTNPQVTVNSSISSQPTPVVTDGADGVGGGSMIIGSVTADGAIIGSTANVNSAAPVVLSSNGTVAPTSVVAPALTPGAFAGGSAATVTTSSLGASPTMASAGTTNIGTIAGTTPATTSTGVSSASTSTSGTTSNATVTTNTNTRSGSVRIVRSGGRVTVTNVKGSNQ